MKVGDKVEASTSVGRGVGSSVSHLDVVLSCSKGGSALVVVEAVVEVLVIGFSEGVCVGSGVGSGVG